MVTQDLQNIGIMSTF